MRSHQRAGLWRGGELLKQIGQSFAIRDADLVAALSRPDHASNLAIRVADENERPAGCQYAIELAGHDESLQSGQ